MKNNYLTLLKEGSFNRFKSTHSKVTKRAFITLLSLLFVGFTYAQKPTLPVDFESGTLSYFTDFGGNVSKVIVDPTDANNKVAETLKPGTAETWAGTTIGNGLDAAIPFKAGSTKVTVRVWSPDAGITVRLKVEDAADNTVTCETDAQTVKSSEWETLTFDLSKEAAGTAKLDYTKTYDKASIFFNFNVNNVGDKTYYWDDVKFEAAAGLSQIDLPVTFEDATVDYVLTDFGNNISKVVVDPTDATNTVAETTKPANAETWAGTTMGLNGFANAVPFTATETKISVRVWSPDAGMTIRLKVEDAADNTVTCETDALTTKAKEWETLTFDLSQEADGTAKLDIAKTYNKASIFFNFNVSGADAGEKVFYWDDAMFVGKKQIDLPVTLEDAGTDYALTDFGGNISEIVVDPTDAMNKVAKTIKPATAETWSGTTMGLNGFANAVPFTATATKMTVRVWSPEAGMTIRLKVEDAADNTITCETDALTTKAKEWEILEFDFSKEADGTAKLDVAKTYNKASIFLNFNAQGTEHTFYWDDAMFGEKPASIFSTAALGLKYFPNPVNDVLNIASDFTMDQVTVFNQLGQIVLTHSVNVSNTSLDMTSLPTGIYMVRVEANNKAETFKITK